jgi:hypothetical protein
VSLARNFQLIPVNFANVFSPEYSVEFCGKFHREPLLTSEWFPQQDARHMTKLINRLFGQPERIGTKHLLSHVYRWTIFVNTHYKIYLDHSYGNVPIGALSRYPKRFISLGLAESPNSNNVQAPDPVAAWMLLIGKSS